MEWIFAANLIAIVLGFAGAESSNKILRAACKMLPYSLLSFVILLPIIGMLP